MYVHSSFLAVPGELRRFPNQMHSSLGLHGDCGRGIGPVVYAWPVVCTWIQAALTALAAAAAAIACAGAGAGDGSGADADVAAADAVVATLKPDEGVVEAVGEGDADVVRGQ
jgi:hypothetical protein